MYCVPTHILLVCLSVTVLYLPNSSTNYRCNKNSKDDEGERKLFKQNNVVTHASFCPATSDP